MAASVCAKENAQPRDVYEKYFDKLKALMEKGVPVPTYHPGRGSASDESESYHFKELGFIHLNPPPSPGKLDKALIQRIKALKITHINDVPDFRSITAALEFAQGDLGR